MDAVSLVQGLELDEDISFSQVEALMQGFGQNTPAQEESMHYEYEQSSVEARRASRTAGSSGAREMFSEDSDGEVCHVCLTSFSPTWWRMVAFFFFHWFDLWPRGCTRD